MKKYLLSVMDGRYFLKCFNFSNIDGSCTIRNARCSL